jgi:hypothetical protein
MADCVTCGDALHPERAEKYDYCTKPECRERNAEALPILAVGVNKAADQFVVLNERTEEEMKGGRYKKVPEATGSTRRRARSRRHREPGQVSPGVRRSSPEPPRPPWSDAQENLAVTYRAMGLKPDAIAKKMGLSPYLVTQILLAATNRGKR